MSRLRPFDIKPGSPDAAIKAGSYAESSLARIAHLNRFSRDVNDIKYYELDLETGASGILNISSKKGIVDIVNFDNGAQTFSISLQNSEIIPDKDKFYVQFTVSTSGTAVPVIYSTGAESDIFNLKIIDVNDTHDWGNLYFYYEIVRID
jgi:hypothetical protein